MTRKRLLTHKQVFLQAFEASIPILFAYFPLGIVFGLVFENQYESSNLVIGPLMSLLAYAGAVQFLALSLLEQGSSILQIMLACFFVALRNAFYGPAFFKRFNRFSFFARTYLIFSLVDATYGLLLKSKHVEQEDDQKYCLYLSALNHMYWVFGTIVGVLAGSAIPHIKGLEFSLTIIFALLALDQYYLHRKLWPFLVAVITWVIMQFIAPQYALSGSILLSTLLFSIILRKGDV